MKNTTKNIEMNAELSRCLGLLEKISEDQRQILDQQQKILTELAEVKTRQKRLQQEMDGDGMPMELLAARNGFIN